MSSIAKTIYNELFLLPKKMKENSFLTISQEVKKAITLQKNYKLKVNAFNYTHTLIENKLYLYLRFREDEIQKIYDTNRKYFYNLESSIENILAEYHHKQFLKLNKKSTFSKNNFMKRKILHTILQKEYLEKERENIFTLIENISKDPEGKEIIREHEIYGEDLLLLILRNLYFN